jgi:hypothetical protein
MPVQHPHAASKPPGPATARLVGAKTLNSRHQHRPHPCQNLLKAAPQTSRYWFRQRSRTRHGLPAVKLAAPSLPRRQSSSAVCLHALAGQHCLRKHLPAATCLQVAVPVRSIGQHACEHERCMQDELTVSNVMSSGNLASLDAAFTRAMERSLREPAARFEVDRTSSWATGTLTGKWKLWHLPMQEVRSSFVFARRVVQQATAQLRPQAGTLPLCRCD